MITIGFDLGTHQTKLCWEDDEDAERLKYTFFTFTDLKGREQVILPSLIQVNEDDTLSYGFVDPQRRKKQTIVLQKPTKPNLQFPDLSVPDPPRKPKRYLEDTVYQQKHLLWEIRLQAEFARYAEDADAYADAMNAYEQELEMWKAENGREKNFLFRYFKQAYFNGGWNGEISAELLTIWYVTNILFDLNEKFDGEYNIQFGIPSGSRLLKPCSDKAMSLLISAFNLMNQFEDKSEFLAMTVDELTELTEVKANYEGAKEDYDIHIFPEAYASLLPMLAQRLMERELSVLVDIGGGTTDMTLFSYKEGTNRKTKRLEKKLQVSWYQSINKGLNYVAELIAEQTNCELNSIATNLQTVNRKISREAFADLHDNIGREILYLQELMRKGFEKVRPGEGHLLRNMLHDRPVIYTGGGSTYATLTRGLHAFSDVHKLDSEHWKRLHITNLHMAKGIEPILSVCLGLAIYQDDDNINLLPFESLFEGHTWKEQDVVLPHYTEDYGLIDSK